MAKTTKRKRPVEAGDLELAAEVLIKAASNFSAFAALMRRLDITVEFDGAAAIGTVQHELEAWALKVRGALAGHELYPDEGFTSVKTTSAAKIAAEMRQQAKQAVSNL